MLSSSDLDTRSWVQTDEEGRRQTSDSGKKKKSTAESWPVQLTFAHDASELAG